MIGLETMMFVEGLAVLSAANWRQHRKKSLAVLWHGSTIWRAPPIPKASWRRSVYKNRYNIPTKIELSN
jgi:hypothetical protein